MTDLKFLRNRPLFRSQKSADKNVSKKQSDQKEKMVDVWGDRIA
jgi:hypothetical protein